MDTKWILSGFVSLGLLAFADQVGAQTDTGLPLPVRVEGIEGDTSRQLAATPDDESKGAGLDASQDEDADDTSLDDELDALLDQDLTSLRSTSVAPSFDVEVSSVTRQESTIGRSPTAIFVISQEMIRRSGVRSIPEALRMAPGLHVASIDGNKWSIGSRGFGGRFANKLLVQIDGRTVYTPLFAGVFWDSQTMLLDDVQRIEVIRGPGATIWGANAVNGIINIISKSAADTHGAYAIAGGGTIENGFAGARLGNRTANGVDWRVSGQWTERDEQFEANGDAYDATHLGQIGFRTDWQNGSQDTFTVQGDHYDGSSHSAFDRVIIGKTHDDQPISGTNVLGRWTREHNESESSSLQAYYDRTDRMGLGFDQNINTIDLDFFTRKQLTDRNQFIWGAGYRRIWDDLVGEPPYLLQADPEKETQERFSVFAQNQTTLQEDYAYFTLGAKLSHNTYSKWEVQPSVRLLLLPTEDSALWASVSRAVRTPSRANQSLNVITTLLPSPPFPANTPLYLRGSRREDSESLMAYEIGYRRQPTPWFSFDTAFFYNAFESIDQTRSAFAGGIPYLQYFAGASADSVGLEVSAVLEMSNNWEMSGWYSHVQTHVTQSSDALESAVSIEGNTPRNQAYLMSTWTLRNNVDFSLMTRYSDNLDLHSLPAFISADARASWKPSRHLEFTVVGQNLLDPNRTEYGTNQYTGEFPTDVTRGVYGAMQLRY